MIITNNENNIISKFEYPVNPSPIKDSFFLEDKLGEIQLTQNETTFFTLSSYTSDNYHSISLIQTGIISGTYTYKDIPSPLLFNYDFIIYPQYCLAYTSDALKCVKCAEGSAFMENTSLCYSEQEIPDHYYLDIIDNSILNCDENCFKCKMLKINGFSECIVCEDNYYIYRYSCVEKCPENSFLFTYKRNIEAFNFEQLMTINVCTDVCEEDYSGHIFQNNTGNMSRLCVLNINKDINENIEENINEFLLLNTNKKMEKITEEENIIKLYTSLETENDFNNYCLECIKLNKYIYNLDTISKLKIINNLNLLFRDFNNLVEDYFSSLSDAFEILKNNNGNFIYFISALNTFFDNNELLEKVCFEKLSNYFFNFSQNLTDIQISSKEVDKINTIIYSYIQFINKKINSTIDYIDPDYDQKEFQSSKYYRYIHEIILDENNIRLMNMIKNLYQFLIGFNLNLYFYRNNFISFYNQKLSDEEEDKEFYLSQLGFNLIILGSKSKITTSTYSTNNILNSIENGEIYNLKIILPPLTSINDKIDWNECSFGLIIYNGRYPFLNMNSTNDVSPDFISINFYDKDKNTIKVSNINNKNSIKIIKKKSDNDIHMGNCVYYDESAKNLNDKGMNSFDLVDYIICTTDHLSDFSIASFSPSYLISHYKDDQESTEKKIIEKSHWIKDRHILSTLNGHNAIIIYINVGIIALYIILLIIKFLTKQEPKKSERIAEDSYFRYTINDDTETDKKILKYIIEKEIDYILKNRSDYENQKKQELALDANNDIFNSDQKIITIIEDESDDDDDEEINYKKAKKVSFRNTVIEHKKKDEKKIKFYNKKSNYNIKKIKGKEKNRNKNKEINIEMSNVKEDNDFIEIDDTQEDSKSNKYKFNFNYKNNHRKLNLNNPTNFRNSTFSNLENIVNDEEHKINNKNKIKKKGIYERFKKNVKEQKSRLVYSILDKTLNDIKNTGQNSLDASSNIIKRPSSLIGINNALNKVSNKEEEKILIKNEFFVIFKIMLFILYQYEFRPIALFNKITLPITRNNLICLLCFRLNLQLSLSVLMSPRYFRDNYSFSKNFWVVIFIVIFSDIIYTIIEIVLMKKKILTSTDSKLKGIIKFKQIIDCLFGYIMIIALSLFGFYNSLWISLYLKENNIKCHYIKNFISAVIIDYIIYEFLILSFKSLIFTYIVYQDSEGFILKVLEFLNKIFIFYLAE